MQDCKSLHVAVMICATLVNTQTDSFTLVILLAQPAELKTNKQSTTSHLEMLKPIF